MGTPFISRLEPNKLDSYRPGVSSAEQPPGVPSTFLDAMEVRQDVFVDEQGVAIAHEFDDDDARCCHWVAYASVHTTREHEVRDDITGAVIQPRRSETRTTPIGTVRLVPFPHAPHPVRGGRYWNGIREGDEARPSPSASRGSISAFASNPYTRGRPTTYHDGRESYVRIGRLAVQRDFRGSRIAGLLVYTVLQWLRENPAKFDPSITELGLEHVGARRETEIPSWGGLVCVYAQKNLQAMWERWGFKLDEGMGTWWEEGIMHVGMFQRLQINEKQMRIC